MDIPEHVKALFREAGFRGGKKRMKSMTPEQRLKFAMKGVAARKRKRKTA